MRTAECTMNLSKEERRKAMPINSEIVACYQEVFGQLGGIRAQERGHKLVWRW